MDARLNRPVPSPPGWYWFEGPLGDPGVAPDVLVLEAAGDSPVRSSFPLRGMGAAGGLAVPVASSDGCMHLERRGVPVQGIERFRARKLSRAAVLVRMLHAIPLGGHGTWGDAVRTVRDALLALLAQGSRAAAELVAARYRHYLEPSRPATAAAVVRDLPLGGGRELALLPHRHLAPLDVGRAGESWEAFGDDPGFLLVDHGSPAGLRGGWYRIRAKMALDEGRLVAPALYPDYGSGYQQEAMTRLPDPDRRGCIEAIVLFPRDVRRLRFDPTSARARFSISSFELVKLGRVRALAGLIMGSRSASGSFGVLQAAGSFLATALRSGPSQAASHLYSTMIRDRDSTGGDYSAWVQRYDTLRREDMALLRRRAERLSGGPLVSILLPTYQTPEKWLRRCIDSVLQQVYPHWELCIADDASPDPRVAALLQRYARRDARIRVVVRESNGHISDASNSALDLATGDFVGLLDHDDELRPHALLEMAEAIAANPDAGLLYSDEDKIDATGRRFQPNFKPDWNPDLLRSQNFVCHFTVIRAALVREVGGFRKGFEGSQDHDLFLRCIERLKPDQVHHVPKVLYHWRAIEGSTALERASKDYASEAGARAVAGHLERTGTGARVEELPHGHFRVHWPLPVPAPKVTVIVPTRDRLSLLRTCIDSVLSLTDYPEFEILVVDNQSSEPETLAYLDALRRDPRVEVLVHDAPFNYARINNLSAAHCDGEVLCLLNNDIEVRSPGWLAEMVAHACRPGVGAVGALLHYPDGTIQHAGVILGVGGVANHVGVRQPSGWPGYCARALVAQELSAVTGACLVVRRDAYQQVGGLDEQLAVAFNDIDFCLRLRKAGFSNIWTPFAALVHNESASRGTEDTEEKRQRFAGEVALMQSRWGDLLQQDPAYNPNLSLREPFAYAFPPRAPVAGPAFTSTARRLHQ